MENWRYLELQKSVDIGRHQLYKRMQFVKYYFVPELNNEYLYTYSSIKYKIPYLQCVNLSRINGIILSLNYNCYSLCKVKEI